MSCDMSVSLCGVKLANPVIAASGTFGFGREYAEYFELSRLGGVSVKGLTLLPRAGNPPPRVAETPAGMLNSVGLQNPGIEAFLRDDLPWLLDQNTMVMANIAGNTLDEYAEMARRLRGTGVHLIELNISCPNVKQGGVAFGVRPETVFEATRAAKAQAQQPLIVKLTPNTADIAAVAKAAEEAGADGISLINTLTGMAVDPYTRKPILANITGGLSGPAIMPVALRMVWQAAQAVSIPVVGMGGIASGEDAARFMLCGASAVMVGTAGLYDPMLFVRIAEELYEFCKKTGVKRVSELVDAINT